MQIYISRLHFPRDWNFWMRLVYSRSEESRNEPSVSLWIPCLTWRVHFTRVEIKDESSFEMEGVFRIGFSLHDTIKKRKENNSPLLLREKINKSCAVFSCGSFFNSAIYLILFDRDLRGWVVNRKIFRTKRSKLCCKKFAPLGCDDTSEYPNWVIEIFRSRVHYIIRKFL